MSSGKKTRNPQTFSLRKRLGPGFSFALLAGFSTVTCAQVSGATQPLINGERLSSWLQRLPARESYYPAGLMWQVPQEKVRQQVLRDQVVLSLAAATDQSPNGQDYRKLTSWLRRLEVTGRVSIAIPDGQWLEVHPSEDPVLQTGQNVVMPRRPTTVTVVLENGEICQVPHRANTLALQYVRACVGEDDAGKRDFAWIAQPDGRQLHYSIGLWNAQEQLAPAPGAWIWAPRHDSGISSDVSTQLVRVLAAQGVASDGMEESVAMQPIPPAVMLPMSRTRDLKLTASDWGEIGLLQTPTARMDPVGGFRLHVSRAQPYTRGTVMFQPLDWLEAGFRYTDLSNADYSAGQALTSQSLKDKSIDVKVRLWAESRYLPQVAVGARDLGGTGLFSGEYIVANKRTGDFDWSIGMGWGYLGKRGDFGSPFSVISNRFNRRPGGTSSTSGGDINADSYFRGRTSLFGGVQWQSPYDPLIFKVEYEGNDYKSDPTVIRKGQSSPFNFGAVYRYSKNLDISAGFERGNTAMISFTLRGNLGELSSVKAFDPPPPTVTFQARAEKATTGDWNAAALEVNKQTGWAVQGIGQRGDTLHIVLEDSGSAQRRERLERTIAVLNQYASANIQYFAVDFVSHGLSLDTQRVTRRDWLLNKAVAQAPSLESSTTRPYSYDRGQGSLAQLQAQNARIDTPAAPIAQMEKRRNSESGELSNQSSSSHQVAPYSDNAVSLAQSNQFSGLDPRPVSTEAFWTSEDKRFSAAAAPSFWQTFGGPDSFMLYQIGAQASAQYRMTRNTWLSGGVNMRLIDNYDKFKYTAESSLPRVRTFMREYATDSRFTISNLQFTHVEQLDKNQYVSAYGGLLESMFAGIGTEWLYRPVASRFTLGVDINRVRQRDFDQKFSMRNYSVTTGHATLYWNTGWEDIQAKLSVGQYLAGDKGATLELSKRFQNGVTLGAYATKTNVSAAQFGEGSFDKGIYLTIPFDTILPRSSVANGTFNWSPLTRDGGAKLNRSQQLFDLTSTRDPNAFNFGPAQDPKRTRTTTGEDIFAR